MQKKRLIYSSYSPNTRPKDLRLNYRQLLRPSEWIKNDDQSKVNEFFSRLHPAHVILSYNHARSALYELFNSISHGTGNVLYQGFTCAAASLPAIWAGLTPIYADINENSLVPAEDTLIKSIDQDTVAVVVQVTLGSVPTYDRLKEICDQKGILLILDSTHFIPRSKEETLSAADAVIYSLGRDKVVSGVDGGVLAIRSDHPLAGTLRTNYLALGYPGRIWIFKRILFPILWKSIKLTYFIGFGKLLHWIYTMSGLLSQATSETEKQGEKPKFIPTRLPGAMASIALQQLNDIKEIQNYRSLLFQKYVKGITDIDEIEIVDPTPEVVPLRLVLKVEDRDKLYQHMYKRGIILGDWYWDPVAPTDISHEISKYKDGSCPNAEKLCTQIINLPLHVNISPTDVDRIISDIRNFYE